MNRTSSCAFEVTDNPDEALPYRVDCTTHRWSGRSSRDTGIDSLMADHLRATRARQAA